MSAVSRAVENRLWRNLHKVFEKVILGLANGKEYVDKDFEITDKLRDFMNSKELNAVLQSQIMNMVVDVKDSSARELRKSAIGSSHSRMIYEKIQEEMQGRVGDLVREIVNNDVMFAKSMPREWAEFARKHVLEQTMKGIRPEIIMQELQRMLPKHIKTNLKLFARTEAAKANAAIVQARAENAGIKAYIWRSVSDERTRKSHLNMDGVIVFYNDPPSPEELSGEKSYGRYHAGATYNCRCFQEPIVDIRFLPNVVRVYHNGRIQSMGKRQMEQRYGKVA